MKLIKLVLLVAIYCFGCSCNTDKVADKVDATTKISVNEKTFNFGEISEKDSITHEFVIKNTGKLPLIIKSAKASCGCTVPKWSNQPVLPNKATKITVHFKPQDIGLVNKSVVIQANIDSIFYVFYIKGNVIKS